MKNMKRLLICLLCALMAVGGVLPSRVAHAEVVDSQAVLAVAVHVSEYTKSHDLSLPPDGTGIKPWQYFQIYTLLEEALMSDGTPFVEISDAAIETGGLLTAGGNPKYPIFISLAAECISDTEATNIRNYVSKGGFAYVGSSAWTKKQDGSLRTSFALSTEMGLQSTSVGSGNWLTFSRARRIADHSLVDHLTPNVDLPWAMPRAFNDTLKVFTTGSSMDHQAWSTTTTTATPLAVLQGTSTPFMAINQFNRGWFIYQAEASPLAGWGEGNVILLEYTFFRKAIEWAFQTRGLPLVRVSAWPYPNQAAFALRHDDINVPSQSLITQEQSRNVHGQYFVLTGWGIPDPSVMPAALAWATSHGAIIGSHSEGHIAPDTQSATDAFNLIKLSLDRLQGWTGTRPKTWVSPYFGAILDQSMQAVVDNALISSGGEQSIGPFPHYALSMTQEKKHYSFVEVPTTFWIDPPTNGLLSRNDGAWTPDTIRASFDHTYSMGGMFEIYDHVGDANDILYTIDYVQSKPWVWQTAHEEIANWWAARSPVQLSNQYAKSGANRTLTVNVSGATSALTALDIARPASSAVTVTLDGSPTSSFRDNGTTLKINSGTAHTVRVSWTAPNNPPVATNDAYTAGRNMVLSVAAPGVLTNDTDADDDALTAVLVSNVSHGSLTLNSNGSLTYTPATNYVGSDNFTYKANDGAADSNIATVSITVIKVPVAVNDIYSVAKDTTLNVTAPGILANDSDPDGLPLTAVLVSGVSHGTLTPNSSGSFAYTPSAGYTGSDSFTYKANNGAADSNVATVSINMADPNATFGLNAGNNTYLENPGVVDALSSQNILGTGTLTKLGILFDDTTPLGTVRLGVYADNAGVPGDLLLDAGDALVANGWVTISGLSLPVTQNNYYWLAFTMQYPNGVRYQNGPPAPERSHFYSVGHAYGPLPAHYTASGFNSTPFVMRATVNTLGNNPPVAANDAYTIAGGSTLTVAAPGVLGNDSDPDGSSLSASLVSSVSHGSLTLNSDGSFIYTPTAGYGGSDSFTYRANDGMADSNIATVAITVSAGNHPPVAANDSYSATRDATLSVAAPGVLGNDTDADGNPLTAVLVTGVSHGTLTLNSNGSFSYTPTTGYTGGDSFTYKANDGAADSNIATVSIAINRSPVAVNDSYSTPKDTALSVAAPGVLANDSDPDGDPLTAVLVGDVIHGALTLNSNGSLSYAPVTGYTGSDAFTYKANDGKSDSNIVSAAITITDSQNTFGLDAGNSTWNENPGILDGMRYQNTAATGTLTRLEVLFNNTTPNGAVRLGVYADNDGVPSNLLLDAGEAAVANGWVSISGLNLPVTQNTYYWLAFDMQNANGVVYQNGPPATVRSHFYRTGQPYGALPAQFVFTGFNSTPYIMRATLNTAGNNPPVAANDSYSVDQDNTLSVAAPGVLGNDSDPDGNPLTAALVSPVSHGVMTLHGDGSFSYTPATGYAGGDSFTYKANDGAADSNPATVSITVNNMNDPPTAVNDTYNMDKDTTLSVPTPGVMGNDSDPDGNPITAVLVSGIGHGSLALNTNGSFTYTPTAGYSGGDSFTYKANDGTADSNVATVSITVKATNQIPAAVNDSYETGKDTTLTVAAPGVLGNDTDPDGDPLTAVLVAGVNHGSLTLNANGSLTYTPTAGYTGPDSFTYKANDGAADSNVATVAIMVNNRLPVAEDDAYNATKDIELIVAAPGVLANDSDADGDPLTAVMVTGVSHGALTLNANGSFSYTPTASYVGSDAFTYKANDGKGDSNIATVSITVAGPQATFGLDAGNSTWNENPGVMDGARYQNTAGTGTLTRLEILFNDTTPNGNVRLGVYADNAGVPGDLLLDAGEATVANGWVSISGLNLPVTLNTYYWLAFDLQSANGVVYQNGPPATVRSHFYRTGQPYGALPAQFVFTGFNSTPYVMRATVAVGS